MSESDLLSLVVRRVIPASPQRLFNAWTDPSALRMWWGPRGVRCVHAEVDLRVGGRYRLDNELPDGRLIIIRGEFIEVEPPLRLVYSWSVEPEAADAHAERVTVEFVARGSETEVIVTHHRIRSERTRNEHELGWNECLDGLAAFAT